MHYHTLYIFNECYVCWGIGVLCKIVFRIRGLRNPDKILRQGLIGVDWGTVIRGTIYNSESCLPLKHARQGVKSGRGGVKTEGLVSCGYVLV